MFPTLAALHIKSSAQKLLSDLREINKATIRYHPMLLSDFNESVIDMLQLKISKRVNTERIPRFMFTN